MVDIDRVRKEHVDRNLLAGIDAAPIEDVRRIQLLPQFEQRAIGAGVGLADREELFGEALGGEAIMVILAVEALLVAAGPFPSARHLTRDSGLRSTGFEQPVADAGGLVGPVTAG